MPIKNVLVFLRKHSHWQTRTLIKLISAKSYQPYHFLVSLAFQRKKRPMNLANWLTKPMMTKARLSRFNTWTLRSCQNWSQATKWKCGSPQTNTHHTWILRSQLENLTKTTFSKAWTSRLSTKRVTWTLEPTWNQVMALSGKKKTSGRAALTTWTSSRASKSFPWSNTTLCLAKTQTR